MTVSGLKRPQDLPSSARLTQQAWGWGSMVSTPCKVRVALAQLPGDHCPPGLGVCCLPRGSIRVGRGLGSCRGRVHEGCNLQCTAGAAGHAVCPWCLQGAEAEVDPAGMEPHLCGQLAMRPLAPRLRPAVPAGNTTPATCGHTSSMRGARAVCRPPPGKLGLCVSHFLPRHLLLWRVTCQLSLQ